MYVSPRLSSARPPDVGVGKVGSGELQRAELTLPEPRGSEAALQSRSLTSSASRGA